MNFETAQQRYLASEHISAASRWVDLALPHRVRTHVLQMGTGRPVVLLHGGGGLAAAWAPLLAGLAGVRLIAPDRPGCGASDGFDYRGADLRSHAVAWCERLFDALELDAAVIVANSMGARWATWFALEHPDRVEGIAMLGTPAMLLDTSAPLPMRLLGVPGLGRLMMALEPPSPRSARTLWRRIGHDPGRFSPELLDVTEALQQQPGYGASWRSLLGACLTAGGPRPGMSLDTDQLQRLDCPITLAVGEADPFGTVEVARRAVASMPDGVLEVAGTGHLPWLDEPIRYARIVNDLIARARPVAVTNNDEAASA